MCERCRHPIEYAMHLCDRRSVLRCLTRLRNGLDGLLGKTSATLFGMRVAFRSVTGRPAFGALVFTTNEGYSALPTTANYNVA